MYVESYLRGSKDPVGRDATSSPEGIRSNGEIVDVIRLLIFTNAGL